MYNCPNCGELLGDRSRKCFRCHSIITEAQFRDITQQSTRLHEEAMEEVFAEYARRRRLCAISTVVFLAVLLVAAPFLASGRLDEHLFAWIAFPVMLTYVVILITTKANKCPVCDCWMGGRRTFFTKFCPRCGSQLRR